jgi:hypothetical protein
VRNALESLPGVESSSIQVNVNQKLVLFKAKGVKDAEQLTALVNDAVKQIEALNFKVSKQKVGQVSAGSGA